MSNLKSLRLRISSVKSTQKTTKVMKMVAAAKLRKVQERLKNLVICNTAINDMFEEVLQKVSSPPSIVSGEGVFSDVHLIIVIASDRGLCGPFNSNVLKSFKRYYTDKISAGKKVKFFCVGKKCLDYIDNDSDMLKFISCPSDISYESIAEIGKEVMEMFVKGKIGSCSLFYNYFRNALSQNVVRQSLIPFKDFKSFAAEENVDSEISPLDHDVIERENLHPDDTLSEEDLMRELGIRSEKEGDVDNILEPSSFYEPSEGQVLSYLLPKILNIRLYFAFLESYCSEQGARMTAMDNATNSANDMIDALTLKYNSCRQSAITNDLIEIVSGASSLSDNG